MVLQQSCPSCPCDEQGFELQHWIACSGVVMPPQSNAYTASSIARTAIKVGFANLTTALTRLHAVKLALA